MILLILMITHYTSYCSIDDAFDFINQMGPGTLLSKIDLNFRLIPVHPSQWNLSGICRKSRFYVDTCLPFGLRLIPYLFNRLCEAIHWILVNKYSAHHLLHYLDDFLTAGLPELPICSSNLNSMLSLCEHINSPIKSSKIEGPSTFITFLGIQLDTIAMEASITPESKEALLVANCTGIIDVRKGSCSLLLVNSLLHAKWYHQAGSSCAD